MFKALEEPEKTGGKLITVPRVFAVPQKISGSAKILFED
jgi:hypothetical protein